MSSEGESRHFGVSVLGFVVVALLIIVIYKATGTLVGGAVGDMSPEAVAERIAPVAQLNTGEAIAPTAQAAAAPAAGASAPRAGEAVYNAACVACHATGVAGAPKFGNATDWAPRIDKGVDALLSSVVNGLNAMPPRGTCGNCSDAELRNAVEYMVSNSQ